MKKIIFFFSNPIFIFVWMYKKTIIITTKSNRIFSAKH